MTGFFRNFVGMKAIVDDKIPYIRGQVEQLVDEVCYVPGSEIDDATVRDADVLIVRTRTRCDQMLLDGSRVRLVVTATIGFDHLDTAYLEQAGIRWTNCPGCNASSVAQYVDCALTALGVEGRTCGVVGVGHVGTLVAEAMRRRGLDVRLCDPPRARREADFPHVPIETIAATCDVITLHTPLTTEGEDATFHLADAAFFSRLRKGTVFINSSRGEVVDTQALLRALERGSVSTAIIDTWEHEPQVNRELLQRAAIATPHIAGYSADGKANATRMALQAVAEFVGKPFVLDVRPPQLPPKFRYGDVAKGALRLYDPRVDSRRLKEHPEDFERLRSQYPLRRESDVSHPSRLLTWLRSLSFRIGVIVLLCCIPCYILSFAQILLPTSAAVKTALWVIFFGLAKAFQYGGITILGVEGYRRFKNYWRKRKI